MSQWKVLDISMYNTVSNYTDISKVFDGIILRAGYRGYDSSGSLYKDKNFDEFYNNLYEKTKIGVYFFSQARSYNEGVIEANYILNTLLYQRYVDFPIYVQSGYATIDNFGRADTLSKSQRTQALLGFCETITNRGYLAGILCSDTWLQDKLDSSKFKDYSLWISNYTSDDKPDIDGIDGWQYDNSGKIDGITGNINLSYFYNDVADFNSAEHKLINISGYVLNIPQDNYIYTSKAIEPEGIIKGLIKDTDYVLSYSNNINVGTATITAKGIGLYTGTIIKSFNITRADITKIAMSLTPNMNAYTGKEITPKVEVSGLKKNIDYTVTYFNNINVGTGQAIVQGANNYLNSKILTFTIGRKDLSNYRAAIPEYIYEYTGKEITPKVTITGLKEGRDFNARYSNNITLGRASIDISGIGDYYGTSKLEFTISRKTINDKEFNIAINPNTYVYDGTNKKPDAIIDGLEKDKDYTLLYYNNIYPGTARIDIVGIGNYQGTVTKAFTITKADISNINFTLSKDSYVYNTYEYKPDVDSHSDTIREGYEYEISFNNNINVTDKAEVIITGIGYYQGTKIINFEITPLSFIDNAELYCGDFDYSNRTYNPDNFAVRLKDDKHTELRLNRDYIINSKKQRFLTNNTYQETTWSVTGIDNFKDSISDSFITNMPGIIPYVPDEYSKPKIYDDTPTIHTEPTPQDDEYEAKHDIYNMGYLDEGGKSYVLREDRYIEGELNFDFGDLDDEYKKDENEDNYVYTHQADYDFNEDPVPTLIIPEPEPKPPLEEVIPIIEDDPEDADPKTRTLVKLQNINLYPRADSLVPNDEQISGYFWIYNWQKSNNRIRLVDNSNFCKIPGQMLGWINISDIKENTTGFTVGDILLVNGTLTKNIDGSGNSYTINKRLMYITEIGDTTQYPIRCIGVALAVNLPTLGYARIDEIKKYEVKKETDTDDNPGTSYDQE